MKNVQAYPILIDDFTHTLAAGRAKRTINLKEKLPARIRNGIAHVLAFFTIIDLDPTFNTAPTAVGMANALRSVLLKGDGQRILADVSGPDIRAVEAYENRGRVVTPDPDLNSASTNNFYDTRTLGLGCGPSFMGEPLDGALPAVLFEQSVLETEAPGLTDISADTTAGTVRHRTYAKVIDLPSVRIGCKTELRSFNASGNLLELGDRALYTALMLLNSASHDAITNGDFDTVTLTDRRGIVYGNIPVEALTSMFASDMATGSLGIVQGEPQAATDDNLSIPNGATPTALTKPTAAYQPVVWSPPGSYMSKVGIEGPLTVRWGGSQSTAVALARRVLPRGHQEAKDLAEVAFSRLGVAFGGGGVKPLQRGKAVPERLGEYMPWDFKVGGR